MAALCSVLAARMLCIKCSDCPSIKQNKPTRRCHRFAIVAVYIHDFAFNTSVVSKQPSIKVIANNHADSLRPRRARIVLGPLLHLRRKSGRIDLIEIAYLSRTLAHCGRAAWHGFGSAAPFVILRKASVLVIFGQVPSRPLFTNCLIRFLTPGVACPLPGPVLCAGAPAGASQLFEFAFDLTLVFRVGLSSR